MNTRANDKAGAEPFLVVVLDGSEPMALNYAYHARVGCAADAKAAAYAAVREDNCGNDALAFDARQLGCQPAFVLSRTDLVHALEAMDSFQQEFRDLEAGWSGQDMAGPEDLPKEYLL